MEPEPVLANPRLAVVLHPDSEGHGKAASPAVDHACSTDITRVGKRRVHQVPRDARASQVSGWGVVVVENVHMPPELAILASAVGAKIDPLPRIAHYKPAAGDEVARRRYEVGIGRTGCE